jgi:hypothetical protein
MKAAMNDSKNLDDVLEKLNDYEFYSKENDNIGQLHF